MAPFLPLQTFIRPSFYLLALSAHSFRIAPLSSPFFSLFPISFVPFTIFVHSPVSFSTHLLFRFRRSFIFLDFALGKYCTSSGTKASGTWVEDDKRETQVKGDYEAQRGVGSCPYFSLKMNVAVVVDNSNNIQVVLMLGGGGRREGSDKVETKRECENGMNQREAIGPTHVQYDSTVRHYTYTID